MYCAFHYDLVAELQDSFDDSSSAVQISEQKYDDIRLEIEWSKQVVEEYQKISDTKDELEREYNKLLRNPIFRMPTMTFGMFHCSLPSFMARNISHNSHRKSLAKIASGAKRRPARSASIISQLNTVTPRSRHESVCSRNLLSARGPSRNS